MTSSCTKTPQHPAVGSWELLAYNRGGITLVHCIDYVGNLVCVTYRLCDEATLRKLDVVASG